jgi:hypothetical protein
MTITADDYRRSGTSEHRLQVMVLEHLRLRARAHVMAIAIPNEGKRSARMGARLKEQGMTPGAPDLVVVLPDAKCAWLELKRGPHGRQSAVQKGMQAMLTIAGHNYGVARTLDEAIGFLEKVGALR